MDIVPKIQSCCLVLSLILTGIRENTSHGDCLYFLTDPIEWGHACLNILLARTFHRQRELGSHQTVGYLALELDTNDTLYEIAIRRGCCRRRYRLRLNTHATA